MQLEDFLPEKPIFHLNKTNKDYELRLPDLSDRVYFLNQYKNFERINDVFKNLEWIEIVKIAYRLMIDRSDFVASQETFIDDEGVSVTQMVSGPQKLLRAISSESEGTKILSAITSAITASEPLVKDYVQNEVKKKIDQLRQTGLESTIPSQANTDSHLMNSEGSP